MSFNFGNVVTTASTGFSFGTPAGDAKDTKSQFGLPGTAVTTQSNLGFSFSSPSTGSNALGASTVLPAPLFGTTTIGSSIQSGASPLTGPSLFSGSRAIPTSPPTFGITTPATSVPQIAGAASIQSGLPTFGSTDQSTFKNSPGYGLPLSTFQSFGTTNYAAPSTAPSFSVSQTTFPAFGSTSQATTASGTTQTTIPSFSVAAQPITVPTFGTLQSTAGTTSQTLFGSSMIAKPTAPIINFGTSELSVPSITSSKPTAVAVQPTLSSINLGYPMANATTATAPTFALSSATSTLSSLPTSAAVTVSATSAPLEFTSGTLSAARPGAMVATSAITVPHTTASIISGSDALRGAAQGVTKSLGSTIPAFGNIATIANSSSTPSTLPFGPATTINTTTSNTLGSSSMSTSTSATAATTYASAAPPTKTSIATEFTIPVATTTKTNTTNAATTVVPSAPMTYGQLEDLINKWTLDLENQSKIFTNQAKQLNAWDRLLIANGDKILALNNSVERVKQQQHQLDQELDFIRAQQKELEHLIVPLEKELQDTPVTDSNRNHTYQLAEHMDSQLKQMSEDLKEIIETLNESNKNQELANPITQIGRILNAHMNSLQWIDVNTNKISSQLDQISKMHDLNRRSHEIVLQRIYD